MTAIRLASPPARGPALCRCPSCGSCEGNEGRGGKLGIPDTRPISRAAPRRAAPRRDLWRRDAATRERAQRHVRELSIN